jgi:hypothetical protein
MSFNPTPYSVCFREKNLLCFQGSEIKGEQNIKCLEILSMAQYVQLLDQWQW